MNVNIDKLRETFEITTTHNEKVNKLVAMKIATIIFIVFIFSYIIQFKTN